jgi:hypothetical protein
VQVLLFFGDGPIKEAHIQLFLKKLLGCPQLTNVNDQATCHDWAGLFALGESAPTLVQWQNPKFIWVACKHYKHVYSLCH